MVAVLLILALGRQRQVDLCQFEGCYTEKLCLEKQNKKKEKEKKMGLERWLNG